MKFTIVAYPSMFSKEGVNHLLVRVKTGEIVGMIEECAVTEMKQILGMQPSAPTFDGEQLTFAFRM